MFQYPQADYAPLGIRAGSFVFLPSAEFDEDYNSNIYATNNAVTPGGVKGDFFTDFRPGMSIRSDWNNDALSFTTTGEIQRYVSHVSENISNYTASIDGRKDIYTDEYLTGDISYQLLHIPRNSPNSIVNQATPTEYQVASGNFSYVHEPGRLALRVDGGASSFFYNNNATFTGVPVIWTDYNYTLYTLTPTLSYEIVPGYHAFIRAPLNYVQYMSQHDIFGFDRSSQGYEIDAGTAFEITKLINGDIFGGYLTQYYNDYRFKPTAGPGFGADVLWKPGYFTSIGTTVTRTVQQSVVETLTGPGGTPVDASSFLNTTYLVSLEQQLDRDILVGANASYLTDTYENINASDQGFEVDLIGRYLINRNLSANVEMTYLQRLSALAFLHYNDMIVTVGLRSQF